MWHFRINIVLFVSLFAFQNCISKEKLKANTYTVVFETGSDIENWFLSEMTARSNPNIIGVDVPKDIGASKSISIRVDPKMPESYCIYHHKNKLKLTAKSESGAKWLGYQFLESLSQEDKRFRADDLPPASIRFETHCSTFDFEYREPFLPTNLEAGNTFIFGTNSVDSDWGIWGHNLSKVLDVSSQMTALVNEERNEKQLCFSSPELFESLKEYIIDHFGYGKEKPYRFMIMPNDNNLVCSCDVCQEEGNTTDNASPSVTAFIKKLAKKFPEHWFFTSAYRTTRIPPATPLPPRSGVFISTIELPQGTALSANKKNTEKFRKEVADWKEVTSQLYAWDYISNFDDYLTPIPILYSLKERLSFFKELDFKGIFLNGSGYDYSSFEDLKTYVAAQLMMNLDNDTDMLIKNYVEKKYGPKSDFITSYYLRLEKDFATKNIPLDIYGGMQENLSTYLNKPKFLTFYNLLLNEKDDQKYEQLQTAMAFTRLQIAYFDPTPVDFKIEKEKKLLPNKELNQVLSQLEKYKEYSNMNTYREEDGSLKDFISFWKKHIIEGDLTNLMLNQKIIDTNIFSENTGILTNGLFGNENDYHQGWYISSPNMQLEWESTLTGDQTLNLRFLQNEKHQFVKPERIMVLINDEAHTLFPEEKKSKNIFEFSFPLTLNEGDQIKLIVEGKDGYKNKIALDEIQVL